MYGPTYRQMDGISPLCSTGHHPLLGPLPKRARQLWAHSAFVPGPAHKHTAKITEIAVLTFGVTNLFSKGKFCFLFKRLRWIFRERSFTYTYALVATGFGLGDESVQYPRDDRRIFWLIIFMSAYYIITTCHLSGYVSAYYSISAGNRVQTTSWLKVYMI